MKHKFVPALEVIDMQSTLLFDALATTFGKLRNSKTFDTASIHASGFPAIVFSYTGLLISFDVQKKLGYGAYMKYPMVNKNHPFIENGYRDYDIPTMGPAVIRALGGQAHGSVDLARGRVSGIYSKIKGDMVFGTSLLNDNRFSDKELAAIFLHELGHLFTYFELLRYFVTTTAVIAGTAKAVYEIEDPKVRLDCLKEAADVLGIDVDNPEKVVMATKATRSDYVQTILITGHANRARSETGNYLYEYRNCEQIADQYAQRQGAGLHLVTALDKLNRLFGDASTFGVVRYVLVEVIKLILWVIVNLFTGLTPLMVLILGVNVKIYDDPKDRIITMRRQYIETLKNTALDDETKRSLLADVEVIRKLEDMYSDRRSVLEFINMQLNNISRRGYNEQVAQKQLEELMSNELFEKAAALSLIK